MFTETEILECSNNSQIHDSFKMSEDTDKSVFREKSKDSLVKFVNKKKTKK